MEEHALLLLPTAITRLYRAVLHATMAIACLKETVWSLMSTVWPILFKEILKSVALAPQDTCFKMEPVSRLNLDVFIPMEPAPVVHLPSSLTHHATPAIFLDAPATAQTAVSAALHLSPYQTATVWLPTVQIIIKTVVLPAWMDLRLLTESVWALTRTVSPSIPTINALPASKVTDYLTASV